MTLFSSIDHQIWHKVNLWSSMGHQKRSLFTFFAKIGSLDKDQGRLKRHNSVYLRDGASISPELILTLYRVSDFIWALHGASIGTPWSDTTYLPKPPSIDSQSARFRGHCKQWFHSCPCSGIDSHPCKLRCSARSFSLLVRWLAKPII